MLLLMMMMMTTEDEGSDGGREAWSLEARRLAHGRDASMAADPAHLKIERERNRYQRLRGSDYSYAMTHCSGAGPFKIGITAALRDRQGHGAWFTGIFSWPRLI